MPKSINWAEAPTRDDLDDASAFLGLVGVRYVGLPASAEPVMVQAKDLLRAARLTGLPQNNAGVAKWSKRIKTGEAIPPCLLVPGQLLANVPLTIAEGYHRVSACYLLDEQTPVATFWLEVS